MIVQEKEIYTVYQQESLMLVFHNKAKEGIHAFNDYLLEKSREIYQGKTLKSTFILAVNGIKQRSSIQVGEFMNDGKEVQSVTLRLHITVMGFEKMGILPVKIVEINQSSSSDQIKLITAQGVDGLEMVRAHIQIQKQPDRVMPQFNAGQIIPILCEKIAPNQSIIDIEGAIYYPRQQVCCLQINVQKIDPTVIEPILTRIKLTRAKLNSYPQALHNSVLEIMTGEASAAENMLPIETIDYSKPAQYMLTMFSSFTGALSPCHDQVAQVEIATDQLLAVRLQIFHSQMKTVEALLQSIQQDPKKKLAELQEHLVFATKRKAKATLAKEKNAPTVSER